MNHTHEYNYFHTHMHRHQDNRSLLETEVSVGNPYMFHNEGHYHIFVQTHEHGKGGGLPHTHKQRCFHPEEETIEHHKVLEKYL